MAVVADIDFEAGNTAEFDAIVPTETPDLQASANAAMGQTTYGLRANLNETGCYGRVNFTPGATDFRARVYIDPNTSTMGTDEEFSFWMFQSSTSIIVHLTLSWNGATYRIRMRSLEDDESATSTYVAITDAPHYIEIHVLRGAAAGEHKLWIDGALSATHSGLNNDTKFDATDRTFLGALNPDAGTSGYLYLDELIIRNDSTAIGPNATTTSSTAGGTTTTGPATTTMSGSGSTQTVTLSSTGTTTTGTTGTTTAATTTAATTSAAPTTIKLRDGPGGHTARAVIGDRICIRSLSGTTLYETWAEVLGTTDPGGGATYYEYSVRRKSGDAVAHPEGATVVVYGPSGSGIIRVIGEE